MLHLASGSETTPDRPSSGLLLIPNRQTPIITKSSPVSFTSWQKKFTSIWSPPPPLVVTPPGVTHLETPHPPGVTDLAEGEWAIWKMYIQRESQLLWTDCKAVRCTPSHGKSGRRSFAVRHGFRLGRSGGTPIRGHEPTELHTFGSDKHLHLESQTLRKGNGRFGEMYIQRELQLLRTDGKATRPRTVNRVGTLYCSARFSLRRGAVARRSVGASPPSYAHFVRTCVRTCAKSPAGTIDHSPLLPRWGSGPFTLVLVIVIVLVIDRRTHGGSSLRSRET